VDEIHAPALVRALVPAAPATMQAHVLATTHAHAQLQAVEPIQRRTRFLFTGQPSRRSMTWMR
jgi:hypothetical protein